MSEIDTTAFRAHYATHAVIAARPDVEALCDEIDRLRVELETERIELGEWKESANANGVERDELQARLAAVEALCDGNWMYVPGTQAKVLAVDQVRAAARGGGADRG